ncbi:hypothetical protein CISIN_1g014438mg [Citrus sinensis]|uniref:Uncharacterized protein n=1 Tax=Citrus sinensis TaxID=2711 RepID=A0A067GNM4_CITSI|nr:hypothetical protein CISIN_1g014438mg [Citrus sinensis]
MDNINNNKQQPQQKKQKWFFSLVFSLLLSTILIIISVSMSSTSTKFYNRAYVQTPRPRFVEQQLQVVSTSSEKIPRLAYLISGSTGDGESLKRTLKALYHPRNQYAVHLDLEAPVEERLELARFVESEPLFVNVGGDWDWFINLSASDYPLVTQDDLLHVLSTIPRNLNFIEHTSDIGWKEYQRAKPVIIDPGLYTVQKSDVFWVPEKRNVPTAYKLFTGSAWMMLSRPFIEFCLWGWDNLPRIVLMYYANFLSSPEGYFHTVICNAEEFRNTTVNHDLHFISWDNPPKQHPHFLNVDDYQRMVDSNAPFARKFGRNEPVLDKIDSELLGRIADGFVPGGWFNNKRNSNLTAPNHAVANTSELKPGAGAERIKRLITGLISAEDFHAKHCI